MSKPTPEDIEAFRKSEEAKARGFQLIGEFIFWFSQLEFTIKVRLSSALNLPDGLLDAVTAPYDFAMLCTVTSVVLAHKFPEGKKDIENVLNKCRDLNNDRVRIAHGMWTQGKDGLMASHVSRQKLQLKHFYENQVELSKLTERARQLMIAMFDVPSKPKQGTVKRIGIEVLTLDDAKPPRRAKGLRTKSS